MYSSNDKSASNSSLQNVSNEIETLPKEAIKRRLLLAEDSEDLRFIFSRMIALGGFEVDSVNDGASAYKRALESEEQETPYDVACLDVSMPIWDGVKTAQELRKAGWKRPLIALTAYPSTEKEEECLNAGFDSFISKLTPPQQLVTGIYYCLSQEKSEKNSAEN